ncbi:VC0807 family protein [Streptomyces sp. WM6378]|uniref:VC0807 family protein n=1 Tax=Streptomyces sp. WM6378 TaxID=1415557 RepID=UPI0006C3F76A|nr:VC0807 family protein [Streptomyces sp. WM6378]KOU33544.1 membrane protein [Streptomyces sp. WM6378]
MGSSRNPLVDSLMPLVVEAGVPLASYYALKAAGMSTFAALALSSVLPAVRTVWSALKGRDLNRLAALVLAANVGGLALSAVSGDPRLMLAKDGALSSVVGIGILLSAAAGRPLMTSALKPWITKNSPDKAAAWDRLMAGNAQFRRRETLFSVVWGGALLTECVARVVGAYTIPVDTMVGLGTVILVVAIGAAVVISGALAVGPMEKLVEGEAAAQGAPSATASASC